MPGRAAAPALAAALVLTAAAPASAHTSLSASTPAAGTAVAAPREVALSFSGPVLERLAAVSVRGADGRERSRGGPVLRGRATLVQPLDPPLTPGRWQVAYRVVAADGHPLTGRVAFSVVAAPGAATSTPAPPALAGDGPARPAGQPADDGAPTALLAGLAVAGLGAAAAAARAVRRRGAP